MKPILAQVKFYAEDVHEIRQVVGGWILKTDTTTHEFQQVVLCTGADPRILQYPKPSIPLEIALSPSILRSYLQGGERIVVFGTSHSGTLILRNLRRIGCRTTAVYRGVPFRWARNHDPEGLKQESATIADEIVGHAWGSDTPTLLPLESNVELVRAIMEADYIIYATGFERRHPMLRGMDGSPVGTFDPTTALIAPGMWGFGIAFPALYEMPRGGQAPDIGFQGFVSQILKCLPGIL
jgi:thioredoxin reductase